MAERRKPPASLAPGPAQVRVFGLTFDRLTLKLAVGVAILVVVPLGAGLLLLSERNYDRALEARHHAAELQTRILETALRHQMMEKDRDPALLARILDEIAAQPEVRRAMILDSEGEIRLSSEPARIGQKVPRDSAACRVCHEKEPQERKRWTLLEDEPGGVLRTVLPIENRRECQECHDPKQRLAGMLLLDISLAQVRSELDRDRAWVVLGGGLLAFLLLAGVSLLVRHMVLRRLARLGRAARTIATGNLAERAETKGRDVITSLASDFNGMARAVSGLVAGLREQESQLASVMNSLDDGLVVLDRGSRIVACNRSFGRRLETQPEALRGMRCREVVGSALPCGDREGECPASRCRTSGRVERAVYTLGGENGDPERVEEVYASPVLDEGGSVVQVVELWRDISERVKEERRLVEIERLVSLGVLASGFSHEVNTPLASTLTSAEAILGRLDEAGVPAGGEGLLPAVRGHADTIREQVLRCRRVTEQFLRFSRGIPPSVEPIDLRAQVAEVMALVRPTAREARVDLRLAEGGPLPAVRANAELVRHALLNLLVNAVQSCGEGGGAVDVAFDVAGVDGPGGSAGAEGAVHVDVRDTGCGIAPGDRAHLFEPFRSRKPQGTGLGLFLSRVFLRRFGGDVRLVESSAGQGSHFQVVFALAGEEGA